MVLMVDPDRERDLTRKLEAAGERVYRIGRIVPGSRQVRLTHGNE